MVRVVEIMNTNMGKVRALGLNHDSTKHNWH